MKKQKIELSYKIYRIDELLAEDSQLAKAAKEATRRSYAPYSRFHVGAAVLLENGVTVTGTNQENVAYPSGLCAERTALFYANSQYPDVAVKAMAIATANAETVISPCGACRQVMIETESDTVSQCGYCFAESRKCMYWRVPSVYCLWHSFKGFSLIRTDQ